MTEPLPDPGPHPFVGGQCHGLRFRDTRDVAVFHTTIIPEGGGPAYVITDMYRRLIFRTEDGDTIIYALDPMNHDDVILWQITGIYRL